MAYIEVIQHEAAEGPLKEIYDGLVESRGKLAEVHKIQSLNPEALTRHMDMYLTIMFGKSPLRRYQREMIAVVVSLANKCEYCQIHHAKALDHFWKDEQRLAAFKLDFSSEAAALSPQDLLLCKYASQLTQSPSGVNTQLISEIKSAQITDRMLLDAAQVVAYFNFVNRLVLGLGVHLEADGGGGYAYE